MVQVTAFQALRYDGAKIGDLSRVIAPPYDVLSPADQDALYARHPENIVRVDLTRAEAGEPPDAKYARAARTLADWMERGVLARDPQPAFYVLAQTFAGPDGMTRTRTGFFCRAKLTPLSEGPILPHERTLSGPKVDRLELMRATRQNLSPIFGLYRDPGQAIGEVLDSAMRDAPVAEAELGGVTHRMWRVVDPARRRRIEGALERPPGYLYIADGHHRYETGLTYRDERRREIAAGVAGVAGAAGAAGRGHGYDHILTFASAVEDPGMAIFPLHRLVHGLPDFDEARLLRALAPWFEQRPLPPAPDQARAALAEAGRGGNAFLLVTPSVRTLLVARRDAQWADVATLPSHPALRSLDVAVLHAAVLEQALGISPEAQARQLNLRYSKDWDEAFHAPGPEVQAAFLMNATRIEQVLAAAEAHQVMPQKSTFFYPKIPSGLVLCPLD